MDYIEGIIVNQKVLMAALIGCVLNKKRNAK